MSDDALLAELRGLLDTIDPVPPEVLAVARGALAFRAVDADLAALVGDSSALDDVAEPVGVRGTEGPGRLVTFECDSLTVEVQVSSVGDDRQLIGQLVPPGLAEVELETPSRSARVAADELGRFRLDAVPGGPVRLVFRRDDHAPVVTGWLVV